MPTSANSRQVVSPALPFDKLQRPCPRPSLPARDAGARRRLAPIAGRKDSALRRFVLSHLGMGNRTLGAHRRGNGFAHQVFADAQSNPDSSPPGPKGALTRASRAAGPRSCSTARSARPAAQLGRASTLPPAMEGSRRCFGTRRPRHPGRGVWVECLGLSSRFEGFLSTTESAGRAPRASHRSRTRRAASSVDAAPAYPPVEGSAPWRRSMRCRPLTERVFPETVTEPRRPPARQPSSS